ncbi:tumor necrosis factor receptor superfamily member 26-like isoform X2 [Castor canadensis]|uniref:Tumor necrosis factor receptor superfamily member 26-like isoform X2 n=1 Tax=Castor canadensis TaxID=51338 RepID=A0AC58KQ94_CASCN
MGSKLLLLLLLLPAVSVTVTASMTHCKLKEYQDGNFCCKLCRAGFWIRISRGCKENSGDCVPWIIHRGQPLRTLGRLHWHDQEEVANCSQTTNLQCQCKQGFYCPLKDCESCFHCTSCPEGRAVHKPCNATVDTVCAEPDPQPGKGFSNLENLIWYLCSFILVAGTGVIVYRKKSDLYVTIKNTCCHRRGAAQVPNSGASPDSCSLTGLETRSASGQWVTVTASTVQGISQLGSRGACGGEGTPVSPGGLEVLLCVAKFWKCKCAALPLL